MQWTSDYIRVWFFQRNQIPRDITNLTPNPSNWGLPAANLQGSCNIDQSECCLSALRRLYPNNYRVPKSQNHFRQHILWFLCWRCVRLELVYKFLFVADRLSYLQCLRGSSANCFPKLVSHPFHSTNKATDCNTDTGASTQSVYTNSKLLARV